MLTLFIFILISILVVSALLFFNKGQKSQEIKSILKDIYENLKELFSNLKKLFLIIKELIIERLDQEPTQLKEEANKSQNEVPAEPVVTAAPEMSAASDEVTASQEVPAEPVVTAEQQITQTSESEPSSVDSIDDENIEIKME